MPSDLFTLAADLARLIGAPITIEDKDTVVIAYAGEHQDVDEARVETILNRQVPVRYRQAISEAGVFDRLRETDEVILVDLPEASMAARAVVALRDRGVFIGSVWAAIGRRPTSHQVANLQKIAPIVARRMLQDRRRADHDARVRDDLLVNLLRGGESAASAADRARLAEKLVVVALRGEPPEAVEGLAGALSLHLSAVAPRSVCAFEDETLYCVLNAKGADRILGDFFSRITSGPDAVAAVAGVGTPSTAADMPHSRAVADDVAKALLRRGQIGGVARLEDVFSDVLVDRARSFLATHNASSPLSVLERYDEGHLTGLVPAVDAYLNASGHVLAAAQALHVHPNTMRNRLRRCREDAGIDPDAPATRLALMVHLAARRTE